jgi:1,4-dihydroxy-2-naphthoyl-CoA hydrolase
MFAVTGAYGGPVIGFQCYRSSQSAGRVAERESSRASGLDVSTQPPVLDALISGYAFMTAALLPDWYADVAKTGLPTTLGIEIVELSNSRVVATMPVDHRTHQPFGILHGGASIALAETVASFGAVALIDRERFMAVGQEINGNHLRPKRDGIVRATGVPIHVGRSSQVWSIEIRDEEGRLVCISRCTMAIVERK